MRTLTAAQMREADRRCIEDLGLPGAVLMDRAGQAVFAEVPSGPVGIVCGKGNNGGDGFVVARLALTAGFEPHVVLVGNRADVTGDALTFLRVFERLGGKVTQATGGDAIRDAVAGLRNCPVLVDALLGTGIRGEVQGGPRAAIEAWPTQALTVAVDLPSGLDADTGEVCGCCVRADVTVTMQFAKRGFEALSAQRYLGRLVVADIGIPAVCADDESWAHLVAQRL